LEIIAKFLKIGFINNSINFSDLIQGEKFIELANNVNIFYKHTHKVNDFFKSHLDYNYNFILISHNSDAYVTNNPRNINFVKLDEHADFNLITNECKLWFAQNIELINPKLIPIPIGFPNNIYYSDKFELLKINKQKKRNISNLVYLNSNIKNNFLIRSHIYFLFKNVRHVTAIKGQQGLNFQKFINDLRNHLFVICPEGNGIDTHLIWEAISQDCIPIVMKNNNNLFFRDKLPILWVDDFKLISDIDFLLNEYKRILYTNYDLKEYHFSYWKNYILIESKNF